MSERRASPRGRAPGSSRDAGRRRFGPRSWFALGLAVLAVAGTAAWLVSRSAAQTPSSGATSLPGPLGGPSVAQDVNTLVGKQAPAFTLSDSDGTSYTVTPGQGKPLVLVFHMGIT